MRIFKEDSPLARQYGGALMARSSCRVTRQALNPDCTNLCGNRRLRATTRRRRRPQLLQIVIAAHCRLHDVHNDVAAVDEHPIARFLAFDADDSCAGGLHRFANVLRQGFYLPARFGGCNDERVVEAGELADIEQRDVAGFDGFEGGDGDFLQAVKSHPLMSDTVGCGQYKLERLEEANRQSRRDQWLLARVRRGSQWPRWVAAKWERARWHRRAFARGVMGRWSSAARIECAKARRASAVQSISRDDPPRSNARASAAVPSDAIPQAPRGHPRQAARRADASGLRCAAIAMSLPYSSARRG